MNRVLKKLVEGIIPRHLKVTPYVYRKAKVLTYIYLFSLIVGISLGIVQFFVYPDNNVPILVGGILLSLFLIIFNVKGNLELSGNLLSLVWVMTIFPSVWDTGGLYSDNLLWLIIAPLLAFLFAGQRSGITWSLCLLAFTTYLYRVELHSPSSFRLQTMEYDATYYFISYTSLFFVVLGIIVIFKKAKMDIIDMLKDQREKLRAQKQEISKQAGELRKAEHKLKAINKELEHFAYVASHDLKEPLRMIKTYNQLTMIKLEKHLDKDTKEYMSFVTDGAERMQRLLEDLLEYSRMGRGGQKQKVNDLNEILLVVMNNLMVQMKESDTVVEVSCLPGILSSSTEMLQLFQNLISNAIKFRKIGHRPRIQVLSREDERNFLISIKDNGIGIEKAYHDKIFTVFERANVGKS